MRYLLILFSLLAGCAKANYLNAPEDHDGGEEKAGASAARCELHFAPSGLCLSWTWTRKPDERDSGTMLVKIWRPNRVDGTPVLIAVWRLGAFLKMANMPHGSSPVTITELDAGTYQVAGVFFSMRGPWYIYVQLKDAAGNVTDKAQIAYTF